MIYDKMRPREDKLNNLIITLELKWSKELSYIFIRKYIYLSFGYTFFLLMQNYWIVKLII